MGATQTDRIQRTIHAVAYLLSASECSITGRPLIIGKRGHISSGDRVTSGPIGSGAPDRCLWWLDRLVGWNDLPEVIRWADSVIGKWRGRDARVRVLLFEGQLASRNLDENPL